MKYSACVCSIAVASPDIDVIKLTDAFRCSLKQKRYPAP